MTTGTLSAAAAVHVNSPAFAPSPAASLAGSAVLAFQQFIDRYRNDAVLFVREVVGVEPDEWQIEALDAYCRGDRQISIRSGHGVGKTAFLAWITAHQMLCRYPQKTAVTAPSTGQLFNAFWPELVSVFRQLPQHLQQLVNITSDRIELVANPAESFVSARTARAETPEAMQGVHSKGWVLLIGDEASGIPEPIFEASMGSMSGHRCTMVLASNPTRNTGYFAETHKRQRMYWTTFHVSCVGSPRVAQAAIDALRRKYGGEDSNAFRVRVLGEFPKADDQAIISYDLADGATTREAHGNPAAPLVWGVDVARQGSDRSVIAARKGNVAPMLYAFKKPDLMQVAGEVARLYREADSKPDEIAVDIIGMGAGVFDRLNELGLPVVPIDVQSTDGIDKKQYKDLRTALWFRTKAWLETRAVALLPGCTDRDAVDDLLVDLTAPTYKFTSSGAYIAESKDAMRARGLPSPDTADALNLTFAGPVGENSASAAFASAQRRSAWHTPQPYNALGAML